MKKQLEKITGNSKKVAISLLFLTVVLIDRLLLDNKIFPAGELLNSNVFRAIIITTIIISVKDLQNIIHKYIEGKFP